MDDTSIPAAPEFAVEEANLELRPTQRPDMSSLDEYELRLHRHPLWNGSEAIVGDVLDSTRALVTEYSELALEVLAKLGDYPEGLIPDSDIRVVFPDAPAIGDISGDKPDRPAYTVPETGEPPDMRGDLNDIVTQIIEKPIISYPETPGDILVWNEDPYVSALLDNITANLNDIILNGGTGLDATFEAAVWARGTDRLRLAHEEKYNQAENYFASKGYQYPPGALIGQLNLYNRELIQQEALLNSDIVAKQLEIGKEHKQFCLDLAVKTEGMTMEEKNNVNDRALDAAKSIIATIYENYKVQLEGIRLKVETYRAELDAETSRVTTLAMANKSLTDTLDVETRAWTARLDAEFGVVESIIKMYVAEMGGYEAEVRAEGIRLNALVERYKAQTDSATAQGQISLGEYEALIKAIMADIELRLGSQKEAGRIAAQIAASALSAFNASASVSSGSNTGMSYSENRSTSLSSGISQSLTNSLGMGKTQSASVGDTYSESKTLNYNGSIV